MECFCPFIKVFLTEVYPRAPNERLIFSLNRNLDAAANQETLSVNNTII